MRQQTKYSFSASLCPRPFFSSLLLPINLKSSHEWTQKQLPTSLLNRQRQSHLKKTNLPGKKATRAFLPPTTQASAAKCKQLHQRRLKEQAKEKRLRTLTTSKEEPKKSETLHSPFFLLHQLLFTCVTVSLGERRVEGGPFKRNNNPFVTVLAARESRF